MHPRAMGGPLDREVPEQVRVSSKSYDLKPDAIGIAELARLRRQAEALFDFEMSAFRELLAGVTAVVDLGAGTGDYLRQYHRYNPAAELTAVERNPFAAGGRQGVPFTVVEEDLLDYLARSHPPQISRSTLYLVRFVLQHFDAADIPAFFNLLSQRTGQVVVIECDDHGFSCSSDFVAELHSGLVRRQERNGGNRFLGGTLAQMAAEAGIEVVTNRRLTYNYESVSLNVMRDVFVRLLAANNRVTLDEDQQTAIAREISFCSHVLHLRMHS